MATPEDPLGNLNDVGHASVKGPDPCVMNRFTVWPSDGLLIVHPPEATLPVITSVNTFERAQFSVNAVPLLPIALTGVTACVNFPAAGVV